MISGRSHSPLDKERAMIGLEERGICMNVGDPLFKQHDLSDLFNKVREQARKEVTQLTPTALEGQSSAELTESVLARLLPRPPVLKLEEQHARHPQEIELRVEDYGQILTTRGTQITVVTPFAGDGKLFHYEPSSSSSASPRGIVELSDLYLKYQFPHGSGFELARAIRQDIDLIQSYLSWIRKDVENFTAELKNLIDKEISDRHGHLSEISKTVQGLGIPIRSSVNAQNTASTSAKEKEYNAFISYATEDRKFAEEVHQTLTREGLRIWFDQSELTVGDSLRESIDRGLRISNYGIVIFSKSYFAKRWTQYELNGLLAREINGQKVILPIWRNLSKEEVLAFSPSMADKYALPSPALDLATIAARLTEVIIRSSG